MGIYTPNASTLLYGGPGTGKTALAVSSFWDWRKHKRIANGKLITFGGEDNPALMIPEECRQTDKGTSLRLTSPMLDETAFLEQFDLITRRLVLDAREGNNLDVLVIDGLSEFDLLFEETYGGAGEGSSFAKWGALLSQMFSMMMRLSHTSLGCHVIMTARVMEKKSGQQAKQSTVAGDPDWVDFDYYPSMRGSFRLHLPHYFNLVLYMEQKQVRVAEGPRAGESVPAHIVNLVRHGKFYVKNVWQHQLLASKEETQIINPMWPSLWELLTTTTREYNPTVKDAEKLELSSVDGA